MIEQDLTLVSWFEKTAEKYPSAIAIVFENQKITYQDLSLKSNQVASYLYSIGVKGGDRVGLQLERSVELIIGMLGILKLGAAYVPLDPAYPKERLDWIAMDVQVKHIISKHELVELLSSSAPTEGAVSPIWKLQRVRSDDIAYLIFTSGSTGKPKGTLTTHHNVVRLFQSTLSQFKFSQNDVWTLFHSYSFDFSVWEIWGALLFGGTLVIVPYLVSRSARDFYSLVKKEKVTILNQTPSAFSEFMEEDRKQFSEDRLSLRYIILGGEPLRFGSLRPWFGRHGYEMPQLVNGYGPTETTIFATFKWISPEDLATDSISNLGKPISDLTIFLLDCSGKKSSQGEAGELYISGPGVSLGYFNRPELTQERFSLLKDLSTNDAQSKDSNTMSSETWVYKTGDWGRFLPNGDIEYLGRIDDQVKIRGFRIELGEIEANLMKDSAIRQCVVMARNDVLTGGEPCLVAYVVLVPERQARDSLESRFRDGIKKFLPEFMIPSHFVFLDSLPMTTNGKVDRGQLPKPKGIETPIQSKGPVSNDSNSIEEYLLSLWKRLLGRNDIELKDRFFDVGGNSLLAYRMVSKILEERGLDLPILKIFEHPSVQSLAEYLRKQDLSVNEKVMQGKLQGHSEYSHSVAIVGMAGRFPGVPHLSHFWDVLEHGKETTSFFEVHELDARERLKAKESSTYVKARGIISDYDKFDAEFFGIHAAEAEVMDPQHRKFLEVAWEALEDSGHVPESFPGTIGVYAGTFNNSYYSENIIKEVKRRESYGEFQTMLANEKDYVATRTAFRLGLTGPAVSVQTACSTSLVAVCEAYYSLINRQCDLALAGGASISVPVESGHVYQEGAMLSSDGHCRPFDQDASGTIFSDGVGAVVLKRVEDAIRDKDQIYAIIRGVAVNNDGANRVSFSAPSIDGQAAVISAAHFKAQVSPKTITYVEAHGTATPLGDPIEFEALTRAFKKGALGCADEQPHCAVGSIKSNFGHLTIAAGVAGIMKTALCLKNKKIPALVHFKKPNSKIQMSNSPFYFTSKSLNWTESGSTPRRAGVSSFGVGGTNAHVILEEAPVVTEASSKLEDSALLLLSAKTDAALMRVISNLRNFLLENPNINIHQVSYLLCTGRRHFQKRKYLVCASVEDAIKLLDRVGNQSYSESSFESSTSKREELLRNLGRRYLQGEKVFWEEMSENIKIQKISIPTYPFEKTRYWIEPELPKHLIDNLESVEKGEEMTTLSSNDSQTIAELKALFEEVSGMDLSEFSSSVSFTDMGMDSLFLTQIATQVQRQFGMKISLRQLLEEFTTLKDLGGHLDQNRPEAKAATPMRKEAAKVSSIVSSISDPEKSKQPSVAFGAMARIDVSDHFSNKDKLTDIQKGYLERWVERYCQKTAKSKELTQKNRKHLADPRVVSGFKPVLKEVVYPVQVNRSEGSKLWDVDGNEYVDLTCGFGTNFFGNSQKFIKEAVINQLEQGIEIGPQHPLAGEVAALFSELTGLERVAFCSTGSEALLGAMRVARTVTGRDTIVSFAGSYHGIFDEVIVRGSKKLKTTPAAPGIVPSNVQNILVLDYGTPEALSEIKARQDQIAGVLVEPVQSRSPDLQPKEFLNELAKITRASGMALIFDEVITGFRVAQGGAQEYFGIKADLATYGKVIGGGLPMGVIAGSPRFMDALDGGFWRFGDSSQPEAGVTYFAGTYVRHPLALAAAKRVLEFLKDKGGNVQRELNSKTAHLVQHLNLYFKENGVPIHIANFSSLFKVTFTQEVFLGELLFILMREKGVHIWDHRPCFLTLSHSDQDIQFVINTFKTCVEEMQQAGFFPKAKMQAQSSEQPWLKSALPRLGRDSEGNPAWFIPDPNRAGKYIQLTGGVVQ